MVETPMVGRFAGENRRLIFGPPLAYDLLVRAVGVVGGVMVGLAFLPVDKPFYPAWWFMIGALLMLASWAAAQSMHRVVFDLRERTFRRRQGPGLMPRNSNGRLDDLDAIVVIAEPSNLTSAVTYHVVLHWKPQLHQPILVLLQDTRQRPPGAPLNVASGPVLQMAGRYAQALGLQLYDNTYFASPNPVPIWS